jgi:hypothetical protein
MRPLLLVLAAVIALKLGQQLFRYYAYQEERAALANMRERLVDAGVEVVTTRVRADSMRAELESTDRKLKEGHRSVNRYGRFAQDGALPNEVYSSYRKDLLRYNERVTERNQRLREYQTVVDRNHIATERYNRLSDSIAALAARIGDPYYPIPKPVEAAAERGLIQLPP